MSRRIVVGLDGSEYAESALALALRRAQLYDAVLIGVAVIDTEYIEYTESGAQPGALELSHHSAEVRLNRAKDRAELLIEDFRGRCNAEGARHEDIIFSGAPHLALEEEGKTADLLILGEKTFFTQPAREGGDETLTEILRYPACPIIAVPRVLAMPQNVIIAYDGGVGAARAMRAYLAITPNLPEEYQVTLLCVAERWEQQKYHLEKVVSYIRGFGMRPGIHVRSGQPADIIRQVARELHPAIVIVGSPPVRNLADRLFGSVTQTVLRDGTFPVFVYH